MNTSNYFTRYLKWRIVYEIFGRKYFRFFAKKCHY